MEIKKISIILTHAFVGWAICGATMWIGMANTSLENALIIHAVAAPIVFTLISLLYFKRFNFTNPMQTALVFVGFVVAFDFFVVALLINRSMDMFTSLLGTWIPFALIFISTYVTGILSLKKTEQQAFGE